MNRISRAWIVLVVASAIVSCSQSRYLPTTPKEAVVENRVNDLLGKMTLEEKIDYIGGIDGFYIRPMERLGLPAIKMSDGPVGVRNYGPTTAYPAGIALAATWNTDLAGAFGRAIGRDARARGVHIWLAPGLNIYRAPFCGRNFEYFGEDPWLASRMAVAVVQQCQQEGILATVKHYACNNYETNRTKDSSEIDERTLREIHLPPFEAAVVEAKAGCVMDAYNLVNGTYCTANRFLNIGILKEDWGFDGVVMSDWGATHDAIAAANGGLDLEMPSGEFMNRENLLPAIRSGKVSEATIDDKVRRILRVIVRAGFLDRPQEIDSIPKDDPANARVALQIAREGIVLLKNERQILPLESNKILSLAVIGPNADPGVPAGGGSSYTTPAHTVSILDGIKERSHGTIEVLYDAADFATDAKAMAKKSVFEHETPDGGFHSGLLAEYFDNRNLAGSPKVVTADHNIDFDWKREGPKDLPVDNFSVRWTGRIRPEKSGHYVFTTRADDGIRVFLNGELIIDDWADHAAQTQSVERDLEGGTTDYLESGRTYDLKVEYYEHTGDAVAQFGWGLVTEPKDSPAVALARKADVAILCVGFNSHSESEGSDRSFELPDRQADLIRAVAEVNPRTIVILNSGGSVAWEGWLDKVPAVLQAWYPGEEGGTALAEILFGDVNPSGKLPATFEKRWEDNPSYPYYESKDGKTRNYGEGIFVGYRGYDQNNVEPQFGFGYGISYTSFDYSDLKIVPSQGDLRRPVRIAFTITNRGTRAGAEVAQVYVHDIECPLPRPPKELKGFAKVFLQPGESKTVAVPLNSRAFSYFDPKTGKWTADPGQFGILVGASSRDIRLKGSFDLVR